MRLLKMLLYTGFIAIIVGCGTSKKIQEPNVVLDQMMSQRAFSIAVESAEPLLTRAMSQVANSGILAPGNSMSRIDVTGSGFFIKIQGDSVAASLPYYGERQMGGGFDSDSGINFDGITKNLEITKDEAKQSYSVKFSIDSGSEMYFVTTSVGNSMSSTTSISSLQRNRIRYSGRVVATKKED